MKKIVFLLVFIILLIVEGADIELVPLRLYLTDPTNLASLNILPPTTSFSSSLTFENPNNISEEITSLSLSTSENAISFSSISPAPPQVISASSTLTFNYNLNINIQQHSNPTTYWISYTNYNYESNAGNEFFVRFPFNIIAEVDYPYLPPNPKTFTFGRNLNLIHYCNSNYHPSQLLNLSGSLYACSNNCGVGDYEWREAYYPTINNDVSATPTVVDRSKDAEITTNTVTINFSISDKNGFCDLYKTYITIISPSGTKVVNNLDISSYCTNYNSTTKKCSYDWSAQPSLELGYYSVKIKVVDNEALEEEKTIHNLFKVIDLNVSITKFYGNTTDFYVEGEAKILPDNLNIDNVLSVVYCGYPNPLYLGGTAEKCGIARNCNFVGLGKFKCHITDLKLTGKSTNIPFIITTNYSEINLSGYDNITINLNGAINSIKIDDPDKYVNIYQPINYTINFSNTGNIGWHGEIYNQTRVRVYSTEAPKEVTLPTYISLDYDDTTSWVNLMNGTTGNFSHFLGKSYYVLGNYNYTANLSYFWPYYPGSLNFTVIEDGAKTSYTVAAIDITNYTLPKEVIRGNQIIGKVKGYFVASMNIPYWKVVQAFKYRVTNKTTTGKFWVTKVNLTSGVETPELGDEITPREMSWNGATNFWEAKINSFDLSCDNENTTHRVYFLINWTEYNIYTPYVKGKFIPNYWPYFYQDVKVKCIARELFEVNPRVANVALGAKNVNIFNVSILNKKNESLIVDLIIKPKDYKEVVNWLSFTTGTQDCGEGCIKTRLTLPANGGGSTIVTLSEAKRVGNYKLEFIVKDATTGKELYTNVAWLNIFSEALGYDNLIYLLLLFFASFALLVRKL